MSTVMRSKIGRNLVAIALALLFTWSAAIAEDQDPSINVQPSKGRSFFHKMLAKTNLLKLRYYFVAQNAANCNLFYGIVEDNPLVGLASVKFLFPDGCECHGHALVTHYTLHGGAVGQRGWVHAKCSDGRSIKGEFTTTSLTTGNGTATDSLGNNYEFTFGHTVDEAVARVNELRRKLHCPECTAEEVLHVEGIILPKRK